MIKKLRKKHIILALIIVIALMIIVGIIQSIVFKNKTQELMEASLNNSLGIPSEYKDLISERNFLYLTREIDFRDYLEYLNDYEIVENYELHYVRAVPFLNKVYVYISNTMKTEVYREGVLVDINSLEFPVNLFSQRTGVVVWEFEDSQWKVTKVKFHV